VCPDGCACCCGGRLTHNGSGLKGSDGIACKSSGRSSVELSASPERRAVGRPCQYPADGRVGGLDPRPGSAARRSLQPRDLQMCRSNVHCHGSGHGPDRRRTVGYGVTQGLTWSIVLPESSLGCDRSHAGSEPPTPSDPTLREGIGSAEARTTPLPHCIAHRRQWCRIPHMRGVNPHVLARRGVLSPADLERQPERAADLQRPVARRPT
jgi:hypothetical protein